MYRFNYKVHNISKTNIRFNTFTTLISRNSPIRETCQQPTHLKWNYQPVIKWAEKSSISDQSLEHSDIFSHVCTKIVGNVTTFLVRFNSNFFAKSKYWLVWPFGQPHVRMAETKSVSRLSGERLELESRFLSRLSYVPGYVSSSGMNGPLTDIR
jgi:hypothetical protein